MRRPLPTHASLGSSALTDRSRRRKPGDAVEVILDRTPFYGESGGQIGDTGWIRTDTGLINIDDTFKPTPDIYVHRGVVAEGFARSGEPARAEIDAERRAAIRRNHTATHLLHRALRLVLGEETRQAGSLVAPDRLRFDFTSLEGVTGEQLHQVAAIVNHEITRNVPVTTEIKAYQTAVEEGAMALFGEKYGDVVRVVEIPGFSQELCGGTHVRATGEIGPFLIVAEGSVAAGVRRIEAVTGDAAVERMLTQQRVLEESARGAARNMVGGPRAARCPARAHPRTGAGDRAVARATGGGTRRRSPGAGGRRQRATGARGASGRRR